MFERMKKFPPFSRITGSSVEAAAVLITSSIIS